MTSVLESQPGLSLLNAPCFLESQLPVALLSAESFKERTAKQSQTLTGLGKWWGRKPLVLVRATILGLLLPVSDDLERDREVFLKLMTMDDAGLRLRQSKKLSRAQMLELLLQQPEGVRERFLDADQIGFKQNLDLEETRALEQTLWDALTYTQTLELCDRPEHIENLSESDWAFVNAHPGTNASSLPELIEALGQRRFGHRPRVGDSFSGGGSIPFEAARIGCDVFASDLNPVSGLLTWGALNIVGGGETAIAELEVARKAIYAAANERVAEWGIEHNELGCVDIYRNQIITDAN